MRKPPSCMEATLPTCAPKDKRLKRARPRVFMVTCTDWGECALHTYRQTPRNPADRVPPPVPTKRAVCSSRDTTVPGKFKNSVFTCKAAGDWKRHACFTSDSDPKAWRKLTFILNCWILIRNQIFVISNLRLARFEDDFRKFVFSCCEKFRKKKKKQYIVARKMLN